MKKEMLNRLGEWLVDGDTGTSSKYLAALILGGSPEGVDYPYDGGDLGRCVKLCEYIGYPLEDAFALAAKHSRYWEVYAEHLSQIMRLYQQALAGDRASSSKLYSFMFDLRAYANESK